MKTKRKWYPLIIIALLLFLFIFQQFPKDQISAEAYRDTSNLIYTKHAKCRMDCRHIDAEEIKAVVESGKLNKEKSGRSKTNDETYALEGWSSDNQYIRIVVTPENNGLLVITVIDLQKDWPCNCD